MYGGMLNADFRERQKLRSSRRGLACACRHDTRLGVHVVPWPASAQLGPLKLRHPDWKVRAV